MLYDTLHSPSTGSSHKARLAAQLRRRVFLTRARAYYCRHLANLLVRKWSRGHIGPQAQPTLVTRALQRTRRRLRGCTHADELGIHRALCVRSVSHLGDLHVCLRQDPGLNSEDVARGSQDAQLPPALAIRARPGRSPTSCPRKTLDARDGQLRWIRRLSERVFSNSVARSPCPSLLLPPRRGAQNPSSPACFMLVARTTPGKRTLRPSSHSAWLPHMGARSPAPRHHAQSSVMPLGRCLPDVSALARTVSPGDALCRIAHAPR